MRVGTSGVVVFAAVVSLALGACDERVAGEAGSSDGIGNGRAGAASRSSADVAVDAAAVAQTSSAGDAKRGQRLLAVYQCGSCHVIPDVAAARGTLGPGLQAFGKRSYIAGHIPNRHDALVRWIIDPRALVPETPMPAMGASPRDASDMAAFLLTLR